MMYVDVKKGVGFGERVVAVGEMLEGVVAGLEGREGEWRERVERLGVLERRVERRIRGLGVWWTLEEEEGELREAVEGAGRREGDEGEGGKAGSGMLAVLGDCTIADDGERI